MSKWQIWDCFSVIISCGSLRFDDKSWLLCFNLVNIKQSASAINKSRSNDVYFKKIFYYMDVALEFVHKFTLLPVVHDVFRAGRRTYDTRLPCTSNLMCWCVSYDNFGALSCCLFFVIGSNEVKFSVIAFAELMLRLLFALSISKWDKDHRHDTVSVTRDTEGVTQQHAFGLPVVRCPCGCH